MRSYAARRKKRRLQKVALQQTREHIAVVVSTKALHKCDVALILKFVVNDPHVRP
jgi:hypothetical protein